MRTPAGSECAFYYEDFHRGASRQECRASRASRSARWTPKACSKCPVPGILIANSSPYLDIHIDIRPAKLGIGGRVRVEAFCSLHGMPVGDPHLGCAECLKGLPTI